MPFTTWDDVEQEMFTSEEIAESKLRVALIGERINQKEEKSVIFRDKRHEQLFREFDNRMHSHDCYYKPVAYLLALDVVCREHATAIFDFDESCIKPECLNCGWQTSTSLKTCRLAFNLYNGYCYDEQDEPNSNYTPYYLFDTDYAPFYWQAVKLHFTNIEE